MGVLPSVQPVLLPYHGCATVGATSIICKQCLEFIIMKFKFKYKFKFNNNNNNNNKVTEAQLCRNVTLLLLLFETLFANNTGCTDGSTPMVW